LPDYRHDGASEAKIPTAALNRQFAEGQGWLFDRSIQTFVVGYKM
jgi:hypothetical protein